MDPIQLNSEKNSKVTKSKRFRGKYFKVGETVILSILQTGKERFYFWQVLAEKVCIKGYYIAHKLLGNQKARLR